MTQFMTGAAAGIRRSAECGDPQAQVNLAILHENRRRAAGPAPSHAGAIEHGAQALKWWLRAANQGSAQAQAALAVEADQSRPTSMD